MGMLCRMHAYQCEWSLCLPTIIVPVVRQMAHRGFGSVKSCKKQMCGSDRKREYCVKTICYVDQKQPGRLSVVSMNGRTVLILGDAGLDPLRRQFTLEAPSSHPQGAKMGFIQSLYGGSKTPLTVRPSSRSAPACGCIERASSSSPSQAVVTASRSAFLPMKAGQEGCIAGTR